MNVMWLACLGESGAERERRGMREKVAFKTKSEIEVLNDGYKWRKYGKKMVKNSPNPRYVGRHVEEIIIIGIIY